jgi:hypothetical protein
MQGTTKGVPIDTDPTMAANSNQLVPSQAAVVAYVGSQVSTKVASVSGTLNRITSTGGLNPVIDISASYVGQSSITTLGTITTGVWTGTDVALADGGTNASLVASNGGIFYSTATAGAILAGTATAGQMLQSGASTTPAWSTATYPAVATGTGTILRADGTNWVATTATYPTTTTSQQILYSTAANVVGQLTTANSAFPATDSSGTLAMRALSVVVQIFTSTGTYTPTSGMQYCMIEVVGSGGGSGGCAITGAATSAVSAGGGGGEYARGVFSAATIGASKAVTVGNAGTAGTAGNNAGGTGGTVNVTTLITAIGGGGGAGSAATGAGAGNSNLGGIGGTGGTGGDFRAAGSPGGNGYSSFGLFGGAGYGGASFLGGGGQGRIAVAAGFAGTAYGSGGGGTSAFNQVAQAGAAGAKGIVIITEYVIA